MKLSATTRPWAALVDEALLVAAERCGYEGVLRDATIDETALLYNTRTGLGPKHIKELPMTTNAPECLRKMSMQPFNDNENLTANFPQFRTRAHGSKREHTLCYDIQDLAEESKHGGNRYVVNFLYIHGDIRTWHPLKKACVYICNSYQVLTTRL